MKETTFKWAWGDHEAMPDRSMTRERAARLLRAWRRASRQGKREFDLKCMRRDGVRFYLVNTTQYREPQDTGILVISHQ